MFSRGAAGGLTGGQVNKLGTKPHWGPTETCVQYSKSCERWQAPPALVTGGPWAFPEYDVVSYEVAVDELKAAGFNIISLTSFVYS